MWRQPFPGPGLAIRVIGEITDEKLEILRDADAIFREEMALAGSGPYHQSVLCRADQRPQCGRHGRRAAPTTIRWPCGRCSHQDFMTATWSRLPYELLDKVSGRIVGEVKHINRIVYDITSKPPATVEWE